MKVDNVNVLRSERALHEAARERARRLARVINISDIKNGGLL